ncbi:MAG: hypothetical protein K2O34_13640 [Acetatifactor sp.]|nr:hypothetical protein [Acetatifactor sp.]
MIATKPINLSEEYRDIVSHGEPIFDTEQNIAIIPIQVYREMEKAINNAKYYAELDKRIERLNHGEGIHKTMEELRAMENE